MEDENKKEESGQSLKDSIYEHLVAKYKGSRITLNKDMPVDGRQLVTPAMLSDEILRYIHTYLGMPVPKIDIRVDKENRRIDVTLANIGNISFDGR